MRKDFEEHCKENVFGFGMSIDLILFRHNLYNLLISDILTLEESYEFSSLENEINYYKFEKPKILKYGIFYKKLLDVELYIPMGHKSVKEKYYLDVLESINTFYNENKSFIAYFRLKSFENDNNIFIRNSPNNHIFALIEATSMMEEFLNNINDPRTIDEKVNDYPKLTWTGSLSELVLLVKALVVSKRINNGLASVKDVVVYFQIMFNVDLKDYYRKYHDVKNSQDPTKFLDYLSECILEDISKSDEKASTSRKK